MLIFECCNYTKICIMCIIFLFLYILYSVHLEEMNAVFTTLKREKLLKCDPGECGTLPYSSLSAA